MTLSALWRKFARPRPADAARGAGESPSNGNLLHREPAVPAPVAARQVRRYWLPALYTGIGGAAVLVALLLLVRGELSALAYLVPLFGVFATLAAGVHQFDTQRQERARDRAVSREQSERESVRRFDERFAAAMSASTAADSRSRISAAVELMSFLRAGNVEFREQTYHFALAYLKVHHGRSVDDQDELVVDHAFGQVFQRAARLLLSDSTLHDDIVAADLSQARLAHLDLSGLELGEADLTGTVLSHADLRGCCLWRAHGTGTNLRSASLRCANLEEIVLLDGLNAQNADFSFANLVAARFAPRGRYGNTDLRNTRFTRARLQGACFAGADLRDAHFEGANLRGATFSAVGAEWGTLNEAALLSILRSWNRSWRKAQWEPSTWRRLNKLDRMPGKARNDVATTKRRPSDVPASHYRRHPYLHHANHPPRSPLAG